MNSVFQLIILFPLISFMSFKSFDSFNNLCKNSHYILEQSKKYHDKESKWESSYLSVHIEEPRVGNPTRFSRIKLNNERGSFELERILDIGTLQRIVSEFGIPKVLLNGSSAIPKEIEDEYRLQKYRNLAYYDFYKLMYGLPMSLTEEIVIAKDNAKSINFKGREAYKINLTLNESIISKNVSVYISQIDFSLVALEFIHEDRDNEIIEFEEEYRYESISIPRFRHWYNVVTEEYQGSDFIIKNLE